MKLAIAVQTQEVKPIVPVALLQGTFEEKVARAVSLGADGIELMTADPMMLDANEIRSILQRTGLEAAAIGSGAVAFATGLTLLHADSDKASLAEEKLRDLIDFAADIAAPLVSIGSFRGRLASFGAGGREALLAVLHSGASYAKARDVRLVLEPLNRYETDIIFTVEDALAFIQELDQPAIGLLIDTYHLNIEESSWTKPFRRAMRAGKLWHVHLGDNNRLPPGKGLIDFHAIVTTLREIGYMNYLSAELIPLPDPDAAAVQTLTYMRHLLEM